MIEDFKADDSLKKLPGLYGFSMVSDKVQFYSFILDREHNLTHELDQQIKKQDLARFQYIQNQQNSDFG